MPAAEVDLAALLRHLVADVGAERADHSAPWPVLVTVDPPSLKRALRNLIDSAVRYGDHGHVVLTTSAETATITVADSGRTIPPDQLGRMFDPFVRLQASRSRDTGGIGPGLAIGRSILHAQGGAVSLAGNTRELRHFVRDQTISGSLSARLDRIGQSGR